MKKFSEFLKSSSVNALDFSKQPDMIFQIIKQIILIFRRILYLLKSINNLLKKVNIIYNNY